MHIAMLYMCRFVILGKTACLSSQFWEEKWIGWYSFATWRNWSSLFGNFLFLTPARRISNSCVSHTNVSPVNQLTNTGHGVHVYIVNQCFFEFAFTKSHDFKPNSMHSVWLTSVFESRAFFIQLCFSSASSTPGFWLALLPWNGTSTHLSLFQWEPSKSWAQPPATHLWNLLWRAAFGHKSSVLQP